MQRNLHRRIDVEQRDPGLFTQGNLCLFRKLCGEDERAHLARYRKGGLGFEGKAAGLAGSFHHLYGDPAHLAAGQANLAVRQRDLPDCHAAAQEQQLPVNNLDAVRRLCCLRVGRRCCRCQTYLKGQQHCQQRRKEFFHLHRPLLCCIDG